MKRTYVITGAGSGMGRATAIELAADPNNHLLLVGRTLRSLEETLNLCAHSSQHHTAALDVREAKAWQTAISESFDASTNLCGVFANAGVGGENHYGPDDQWSEIISINLTGTYTTIMELLPWLQKSQDIFKHIVITSSCLARFAVPNYTAYCTAKTGLLGLTRSMALQFAANRILVNAICPGWVETEMAKGSIQRIADRTGQHYEQAFQEQMGYVPLQRISQPAEIARMVKFLFSNEQTSMTGQGIDINNGSVML
jgi:NAD(P)-dependent dehydrogenase (short-subunit alcohol dehydrogenase family)